MAIIIKVDNASAFLETLKEHINARIIKTWIEDADGDYTLSHPQWVLKSWFQVKAMDENIVAFGIIPSKYYTMSKELYGVYHGRMAATLLANFDEVISHMEITPGFVANIDIIPKGIMKEL